MKSVFSSARSSRVMILALFLPLTLVPLAAARAPEPCAARGPLSYIKIHAREGSESLATANPPIVQAVRYLLKNALVGAMPGISNANYVRQTLTPVFGPALSETSSAMGYHAIWDPELERWIIICSSASQFEIDFGALGGVIVDAHDSD